MTKCEATALFWAGEEDFGAECELEKGHEGLHVEFVLEWEDDSED